MALNISLEVHLQDILTPLLPILPPQLANDLAPYVQNPSTAPATIPYALLLSISQWSRSTDGAAALEAGSLEAQSYTMISLLAGTTTSPERKFPGYVPPEDPEEVAAARKAERKAITTLLNALLSIFGCGFAAWWAADKTGWKHEWRVLFAMGVAAVVALSEAGLYLIYESRSGEKKRRKLKVTDKKREQLQPPVDSSRVEHGTLRHRRGNVTG
ncbi:hypothetical protein HMN09_00719300 [Mycena chlorophos]|uniref:Uncharacterized protein n=1 Tax=Mycena chlorophos TaxID=658473 RepID=A0A8H6SZ68_MYCCL|nr:hypothetical protein HMN09_00719300 [Mycena chlorophos]